MYCSKVCQKRDWKREHRDECVIFAMQGLSVKEEQIVKEIEYTLDALFTQLK